MSTCWEDVPENCGRLALEADLAATKCYRCGLYGHRVSECPAQELCVHCHRLGHRISECPEVRPMQIKVRVSNWRRMLQLLGVRWLLGAVAVAAYWWIR